MGFHRWTRHIEGNCEYIIIVTLFYKKRTSLKTIALGKRLKQNVQKEENYRLEDEVNYWSDYLYSRYHPKERLKYF